MSAPSRKTSKLYASATLASSMRLSEGSGGPSSPVELNPFDEGSSGDSDVVRATLAKSRSFGRRPTKVAKRLASAPPNKSSSSMTFKWPIRSSSHPGAASVTGSALAANTSLKRAMFWVLGLRHRVGVWTEGYPGDYRRSISDLEENHLLPPAAIIPGIMQLKTFTTMEVALWPADLVSSWSIMMMSPSELVDLLNMPWGWFGTSNGNVDLP